MGPFFSLIMKILNPTHKRRGIHVSHPLMKNISILVRHISRTTKRKGIEVESDSEGEDDAEDRKDQENDDDEGEDDEDDCGQRYIKEENLKVRYPPLRGNKQNSPPCNACVRRNDVCYAQDSTKMRGACYECGRMKTKCIFSVIIQLYDNY